MIVLSLFLPSPISNKDTAGHFFHFYYGTYQIMTVYMSVFLAKFYVPCWWCIFSCLHPHILTYSWHSINISWMNAYGRVVMYQTLSLYNGILEYASKCLNSFQNCDFWLGGENGGPDIRRIHYSGPSSSASRGTHRIDKITWQNFLHKL